MRIPGQWLSRSTLAHDDAASGTPGAPGAATVRAASSGDPGVPAGVTPPARQAAAQPGAARPRVALSRLKASFLGREVDVSLGVPGSGRVTERPVRAWPQPSLVDGTGGSPTLQAQALRERIGATPPGVWERPDRSSVNRIATTLVPWLAPRPLAEKAVIGKIRHAPAAAEKAVPADLERLEQNHDDAQALLAIARTQVLDAGASSVQPRRQAEASLQAAAAHAALAAASSAEALQPVAAQVLELEQRVAENEFRRARLADLAAQLYRQQSAAMARLRDDQGDIVPSVQAELAALAPGVAAVLEATQALAREPDVASQARAALSAFERLEAQALELQARVPAGFDGDAANARFGERLLAVVRRRPDDASADALPAAALMEIASRSIARVAGGDGARAAQLLQALHAKSPGDWLGDVSDMPEVTALTDDSPSVTQDVHALWRLASAVPRGAELLHLLGAPGTPMPDALRLQATQAFWTADAAQRGESDPAVRRWLAGAKRVARRHLDAGQAVPAQRDADEAAYNAVRNGCVSDAAGSAFDQHDRRLRKATEAWIDRVRVPPAPLSLEQRLAPGRRVARLLAPHRYKTPYDAQALATDIAESFGMRTQRRQADVGTRAAAARLVDWARVDLAQVLVRAGMSPNDARAFVAATAALAALALAEAHPAVTLHGAREHAAIRADAYERLRSARQPGEPNVLRKPNRGFAVAPPFDDLLQQPGTSLDKLRALADYLRLTLVNVVDETTLAQLAHDAAVHAAAADARRPRFESREDVVRYFEPILGHMQLRDRLRLSAGGTVGGGLPSLPYSLASPIASPLFAAGLSRKDEAFLQVFMPILGMELSVGGARTTAVTATLGAAAGPDLSGVARLQASATQKLTLSHVATRGTVLRLQRTRGRDDAMRAEMLGVLDTWFRWEQHRMADGGRYRGPLEAVLARHPAVSLGQIESTSTSRSGVAHAGASAALSLAAAAGETNKLSVNVGVNFKAERIADRRTEHGGHVQVRADAGDTAQQKISVGAQLNTLLPANGETVSAASAPGGGALAGGGVPGVLDFTRDVFWNLEKHSVSPFLIGGKQDADLDRHYSAPPGMLAEIRQHRDAWLARCAQTLPADATGATNTRANREAAEALLVAFEARVEELGRTSRLCQYNVNYSMRPQASAWIDAFRALQALAALDGDSVGARRDLAAANRVMQQATTWRPLMLIVREKGREARTVGINFVAQVQGNVGVEGQRTAAQFPPP